MSRIALGASLETENVGWLGWTSHNFDAPYQLAAHGECAGFFARSLKCSNGGQMVQIRVRRENIDRR